MVHHSCTTLYALSEHVPNYETLWEHLGTLYTMRGLVMIIGGIAFRNMGLIGMGVFLVRAFAYPERI